MINEYISRDEVTLSKYLQMSEDEKSYWLPFEYYYHISDFFNEYHEFYDVDGLEDFVEEYEDEEYDMVSELETRFPKVFTDFGYWLYDKIETFALGIPDAEYPTWAHMDFTRLVKNTWLIHFTNNADEIASSGFKRGVDDHTKLGLTTQMGEYDKKFGGYNFAYDATTNYGRYIGSNSSPKYGSEAVLFRASGIEVWHHGDEEPQVIFYGNTARDIIPISGGEEYRWAVKNIKTGGDLYGSDSIEEVTDWVIKNHSQYRKVLHETAKRTKIILNERLYKLLCENEYKGLKNLVGYNIARYETRLSNSLAELSKFLETLFTKNTDSNLSNEAGSLYLNSASGNKVPLENLTHILNAIADGYVKTKEEVYKISTILPRALEDGSNFRQTIVDILSKSFEDKNGVDNKKFSGDIVSRYHVPFNKVFDKLKSLNEKTKNLQFNPLNLQVIDKQTHAGREILEIKDDGANIIVLMYKSTGKGDPELKKKGEWIAIPAFSDYNRVKNWFVKSKASVMWSKGENQYLTQLSQFLNRNYNQIKNLFEAKKTEVEKEKRNVSVLRKIIREEMSIMDLLAPNGKKSNLSHSLYQLVRTKKFKSWFGDWENNPASSSKVVDENGEPLVVSHGTKEKQQTHFNSERLIFTTANKKVAQYFGNVHQYFMNVRNPFILDEGYNEWSRLDDEVLLKKLGKETYLKIVNDEYNDNFTFDEWEAYVNDVEALPISIDVLSYYIKYHTNYDGVIALNIEETTSYIEADDYICFNPSQIKSINDKSFNNT